MDYQKKLRHQKQKEIQLLIALRKMLLGHSKWAIQDGFFDIGRDGKPENYNFTPHLVIEGTIKAYTISGKIVLQPLKLG